MPEVNLEELGKSVLEVLMNEAKSFYQEEGKQMLQEDEDLVKELATDASKASYKLGLAKAQGDEAAANVYIADLKFISSTLRLRLMQRELQLVAQSRERFEKVLQGVLEVLEKVLPVLLKSLLAAA